MKAVLFLGAPRGGEDDLLACVASSCMHKQKTHHIYKVLQRSLVAWRGVALHCKASIIIIISILPMQPSGAALPAVFTSERATRRHMNARAFYLVLGRCCIQFGYFAASGRCGFPSPWKRHGSLPDGIFLKTKLCSRCSVFCYSKGKHAK